jgi:hypothetical protein
VDLGCIAVALAVVGWAFDAVVFREVAFDYARVGALPPFRVDRVEDFREGDGDGFSMFMRGESPPAR